MLRSQASSLTLLALSAVLGGCSSAALQQERQAALVASMGPQAGQVFYVVEGTRLPAGRHQLPPLGDGGTEGVIRLEGARGVELDLRGVEVRGQSNETCNPDAFGFGIVLVDCQDVVIRGGTIGGYKSCIVLQDSTRITLDGVTFDGWFGQELGSSLTGEDPADQLEALENAGGEWTERYGAAIHATNCSGLVIKDCSGRHGQNGIVCTNVTDSQVYDNDFSFLSGWGFGCFAGSRNIVSHNRFDYCVRGYGHGVYAADHGASGMLLAGHSSDNVIRSNSATHCGTGLRIHGGLDLLDGSADGMGDEGGSDRNLIVENDLRFAVTAGLDAAFSRQGMVLRNRIEGCREAGVQGRYCADWVVHENEIDSGRGSGLKLDHSQGWIVSDNTLTYNEIGVELSWEPEPDIESGPFAASYSTRSEGHWILGNTFESNDLDLVFAHSEGVTLHGNRFDGDGSRLHVSEVISADDPDLDLETVTSWLQGFDGSLPSGHVGTCSLSPWQDVEPEALTQARRIQDPPSIGDQVVNAEVLGVHKGGLETIVLGSVGPWDFRSGEPMPTAARPGGLLGGLRWDGRWFSWNAETHDPRGNLEGWLALSEEPLVRREVGNFVQPWGTDDVRRTVGTKQFGLVATSTLHLDVGGTFRLAVTSDDGVRIFVDDEVVFEDWTWHAARRDEMRLDLGAGEHGLRVEYFQVDGASALTLGLVRDDK
tara:strand:+ start:268 stop:2391 length:2124 start_codon:yes stop_codon:yes gene_type:complete